MVTYTLIEDSQFRFELYSAETLNNQYVALGLADQPTMGNDIVIECVNYRNQLKAYKSLNSPDFYNTRQDNNDGLRLIQGAFSDGILYCMIDADRFLNASNIEIDLLSSRKYLLLAKGAAVKSNIEYHFERGATGKQVKLTEKKIIYSAVGVLKKLHGSLMVIAWLMASSIGMLFPRYMKKTWVGKQWMGKDRWFMFHQVLMFTSWLLTCVGFVVIIVDLKGWVKLSIVQEPHPLIGCITIGLAFIQPLMAFMRPAPSSPNRKIFNWVHRCVGYSAHLLAVVCIFLAVEMEAVRLPTETYWIIGAQVVIYVLTHSFLTVMMTRNQKYEVKSTEKLIDERGSTIRKSCVGVFSFCTVLLSVAVIVLIGLN